MIRALVEQDTAAIAALESELFGSGAWSEALVHQEINAPARNYVVDADSEGIIRGYAGYWYDGDDAELMTIAVSTTYQRRGIASAMLRHLLLEAKRQGAHRMLLEVRVDNQPAIKMYQRFGFTQLGIRKHYYQPEGVDAYTMANDIDQWAALDSAEISDQARDADDGQSAQEES
ncbi:ribosomal protein S18-alanine N-acetyltransferase [Bifidobacterium sp.]|jgi:ribosomal-protein-alanine N-acetyltransferase|uniref:ribosomal protein S18-alanine N-acetyltransferase n=1 Tax=Bifidobacterium sp. TaxID=41200 RepID=UPI0025C43AE3|nr:ribosomal protein S18-alanine N-acetyltransferase [Bifidobacterium sp.]MCI1635657.1 ribosomal protein S18-alanine N-acetyltransferase [Bifidobacterium sp.]